MKAPVYISLITALLAACLFATSASAAYPALAAHSYTIEFPIAVGENDTLRGCRMADSGLAVGSLFGFSHSDQHRGRCGASAIQRIMPEPGFSEDNGLAFANPPNALVKGARLSPVRGLDDHSRETISPRPQVPTIPSTEAWSAWKNTTGSQPLRRWRSISRVIGWDSETPPPA